MKIVSVDWVDSAHLSGWRDEEQVQRHDVARCQTVGFLVRESDNAVYVALSRDAGDKHTPWGDVIAIPWGAVTDYYELVMGRTR